MANYNRIILAGNMTRDPELSYTPSGTPMCKFGLAVNRKWTDRNTSEKHEETMFIDCTAWAKSGELINQYCRKGKPILIEGRLDYRTWTTDDGQKRSKHSVVVDNFQFLGGPGPGAGGGDRSFEPQQAPAAPGPTSGPPGPTSGPPGPTDVPF